MREHIELVYILQKKVEKGIVYFLTDYNQSHFLLPLGRLDIIKIFFDSRKGRISVVYMREHTELVYIQQNRVE